MSTEPTRDRAPMDEHGDHEADHKEEGAPPGAKAMGIVRWILLVASAFVALGSWWSFARADHAARGSDSGHTHGTAPSAGRGARAPKYQCPMHPQIVSDEPGTCPICHMELEPISAERAETADGGATGGQRQQGDGGAGSMPPGAVPVVIALDRQQAIGVRTAVAREEKLTEPLRVTAVVAPTDQGVAEVHVRASGFVERIDAGQLGVSVARGQVLFLLYSPEIFQAESELLASRGWDGPSATGALGGDAGARVTNRARVKLELLGMAPADIDKVVASGQPMRRVPVYAPQAGYIAKKAIVSGSYVTPEAALYEIQDLSRVYVIADVLQRDVQAVKTGIVGTFTPAGRPNEAVEAKVDLVYPVLNAEARTARVRMQVKNAARALRPGEYGTVSLATPARSVLVVPRDAVVDTGAATYVFVVEGEERFVPRAVTLGGASGDALVVAAGVSAGERVVSGATFLLDSESRLRASVAAASAQ